MSRSPSSDMDKYDLEKTSTFSSFSNGAASLFRLRDRSITVLAAIITTVCLTATIFFAYNSSLDHPILVSLVAKSPQRTILILNVMSQVTLFFLAELTKLVLEATRWALACSENGTSALTFLALGQATGLLGTLYLSFGPGDIGAKVERNGPRVWGIQRLGLTLIRALLGVVLLSDVNFQATYREVQDFPLQQAGLTAMNTSLVNDPDFQYFATGNFWWHFPSMMSYAYPVTPLDCPDSSPDCQAFYFPGPLSLIQFPKGDAIISATDSPAATTLVEKDAPGYQIEFEPKEDAADPQFTLADCRVFGIPMLAVQVCLKESNNSFIAAWNPCPYDVAYETSCLNTTDWRSQNLTTTKMTISKRYASTVFDRSNHSIVDVIEMSPPTPVTYAAQDFFAFYEYIFKVDLNSTDFPTSTPYSFLLTITSYLQNSGEDNQLEPLGGSPQRRLQEFLATPVIIYNDAWLGSTVSDPDMGKTLSLAIASYSLLISSVTLYSFMVGGIISLLWCLVVLALSFSQTTPGTSFFPEIDFASKVTSEEKPSALRSALPAFLSALSMAGTVEIKKALERVRFYVHMNLSVGDSNPISGRAMRRSVIEIDDGRNYDVQVMEKRI